MKNLLFQSKAKKILEDLYIDPKTDKLQFDYKGKEGLKIKFGKGKDGTAQFKPYVSRSKDFGDSEVISLISTSSMKGKVGERVVTPIMKALKGQSATKVNKDDLKKWLASAARVMGKYIDRTYKPDAVLAVKSSSALNNLFVRELSMHLHNALIIPDAIGKADISKITVSKAADDKQKKAVERELKKARQTGVLSFKKIHVSLRKFFKGVMKVEEVAKNIEGKTVIVIDDIMTTRTTQMHAIEVIKQYNPKEVIGVTLFKT